MRRFTLLALALLWQTSSVRAEGAINTNETPYAIGGYDPVAYFADGKPARGKPEHVAPFRGAHWLFASAEHRTLFVANPERYLPQYDRYCAYGVSRGYLVKVDPAAFTIRGDKLYLNYSLDIRSQWLADVAERIRSADRLFPTLKH